MIFKLGNTSYLTPFSQPKVAVKANAGYFDKPQPLTIVKLDDPAVTDTSLQDIIARYTTHDDVFTTDFLVTLYIYSPKGCMKFSPSAVSYLSSIHLKVLFVDQNCTSLPELDGASFNVSIIRDNSLGHQSPPGPYIATSSNDTTVEISKIYRLYEDFYEGFVNGGYPAEDSPGAYRLLEYLNPEFAHPMIPVPSRIHYWDDNRPLAGERVGVKDIYDVRGLTTTKGSISWYKIATESEDNGPAIERLIELGAVIVGKQKTSQFASAADPWDWDDVHPPFNPRGDGYLTCSASSAGGACSIAAYEWLDYAIGSDTGQSVRRPAAVSGIFGNRPSQGLMNTDGVMPISFSTDTLGILCRDPHKWAHFARHWYTPALYQNESMTHLPPLSSEESSGRFPTRLLYTVDYLPLPNPQAEGILQSFIHRLQTEFNMTVHEFNFKKSIEATGVTGVANETQLLSQLKVLWTYNQLQNFSKPFLQEYAAQFDGEYPPMDAAHRTYFREAGPTAQQHADALKLRRTASDIWQNRVFGNSNTTCSESILLYDIGSGGIPSFREYSLNETPGAAFLAQAGTNGTGGNICAFFGCVDVTVPIGQVPYYSNTTFQVEYVPVAVSMVARRGCDRMLFDFLEKAADAGIISTVRTGRLAF
ncbi:amidase family protein [Aspergillus ellipticus CBS 707.79]|uniref:Amidase family protein n=1 Tax=Aspergillus ellipticus CBS 707.79 TaxID=1448320 RepID=A0A319DV76_9EURO|nr:amidase family protein [Aspergillus ellipticus CBS 707.79]